MGLSFDILIFDCLLKAPQPVTGLFFKHHRNHQSSDRHYPRDTRYVEHRMGVREDRRFYDDYQRGNREDFHRRQFSSVSRNNRFLLPCPR